MISEAEMPATFSDIRGQTKESATKAEKHQPYNDDVADLAHPLFPSLLSTPLLAPPAVRRVSLELEAWFWS